MALRTSRPFSRARACVTEKRVVCTSPLVVVAAAASPSVSVLYTSHPCAVFCSGEFIAVGLSDGGSGSDGRALAAADLRSRPRVVDDATAAAAD